MSEFKPTASQAAAIETRGSAVLISAGAGSGKTKVLTERLMGYVCAPTDAADLDSFLIITFTRAAAGELRGRIMEELAARLAADPANRRLRRQSALCQRAQIGTIHSFCSTLLRENCQMLGLSPDFKVLDDERAETMRRTALENVLDERYEHIETDDEFRMLADTVGAGRDDRRLSGLVLTLHSRMQSHARPEKWAQEQIERMSSPKSDAAETVWGREILDWAEGIAGFWAGEYDRMIAQMGQEQKIYDAYFKAFNDDAEQIRELERCLRIGWDRARACLPIKYTKLNTLRKSPDPELSEKLKARRDAFKKSMKSVEGALYASSEPLLSQLEVTAPVMKTLLELTLEFDRRYGKDKLSRGFVDYADLEHMAARLLTNEDETPTELAQNISARYTEIMVDEYQDVSAVQDLIFRSVSRGGKNLFMVGDVKQSIYRFRLADPDIFNNKYREYKDSDKAAEGEPRRILLRENFRSRREIIDAANSVFSLCMSRELGEIDYDGAASLVCGADYPGEIEKPELMLLALPGKDEEDSPDKTALEAAMVAEKIEELLASRCPVTDHGVQREIRSSDIAILLRSANTVGGVYCRALSERGIPVSSVQSSGFFTSVEISTVMSMLAVIDNPHKDIPLIAVLRYPAFGFTPDELSYIRACDKNSDFYTALMSDAAQNEKTQRFIEKLGRLRACSCELSSAELVWRVIEELDMLAICSAMSDGRTRRANLMELMELSEGFEATGYRGLHRFVLWLRRLAEKGQEPSSGSSGGGVQIMSVHKSKGLEFPVVFLCDTARRFNKQDGHETVLVHPRLGLGPKYTDLNHRVEYPTLARNAIRLRLDKELLSEEMRLLYVALTRPKERLFITAALKDPEKVIEKQRVGISIPLAPEFLAQALAPVYWLISAALADDGRTMNMKVYSPGEKNSCGAAEAEQVQADEAAARALRERLSFVYPHPAAVELPSKLTATELKGGFEADEDAESLIKPVQFSFNMPRLTGEEPPLTAAQRGIATHLVLQYMDYEKGRSRAGIRAETERLLAAKFLSEREAKAVNAAAIERLFSSELGQRMLGAKNIMREFRFSVLVDAGKLYSDAASEEILLQGVVDCCIEESDGLVIIDYKTDSVKSDEELEQHRELYRGQLMAYAEALERICKKPVKECVLYFLSASKAIEVYKKPE